MRSQRDQLSEPAGYKKIKENSDGGTVYAVREDKPVSTPRKIIAQHVYRNEAGVELYRKLRYEPKGFAFKNASGGWGVKDVRRVLYNLNVLSLADKMEWVFICEGEKDCDKMADLDLLAVCNDDGAKHWRDEYSECLKNRRVCILPDNDADGSAHAVMVARSLADVSSTIKIVNLPDLPEKGDVSDYIDAQRPECDVADLLLEVAAEAGMWVPTETPPKEEPVEAVVDPPAFHPYDHCRAIVERGRYNKGLPPVTTGFTQLDEALGGGFRKECCYVIAGRTGAAKSTLASNVARHASGNGICTLLFKLEECVEEVLWRVQSAIARMPLRGWLDGAENFTMTDRDMFNFSRDQLIELPLRVSDHKSIVSIEKSVAAHAKNGGDLVIVDQLSMVEVPKAVTPYERVSMASDGLRVIAQRYGMPVVVVCQINRAASKEEKPLTMNDLRDSGVVENNAAGVLLIDRAESPFESSLKNTEIFRFLNVIIGKNRYGMCTKPEEPLRLGWWPVESRIEDESPQWALDAVKSNSQIESEAKDVSGR